MRITQKIIHTFKMCYKIEMDELKRQMKTREKKNKNEKYFSCSRVKIIQVIKENNKDEKCELRKSIYKLFKIYIF